MLYLSPEGEGLSALCLSPEGGGRHRRASWWRVRKGGPGAPEHGTAFVRPAAEMCTPLVVGEMALRAIVDEERGSARSAPP